MLKININDIITISPDKIGNTLFYSLIEDFNYLKRKLNNINYIILDNLDIIVKKEYENNYYLNYYFKVNLINILERRLLNEK